MTQNGLVDFNITDGLTPLQIQKLNTNFRIIATKLSELSSSSGNNKVVVNTLQSTVSNIRTSLIEADQLIVDDLEANYAHIVNGVIDNAKIDYADVNNLNAHYAHISNGVIDNADIDFARIRDVLIDTANIKDAAITTAKIKDAAITTAKINDASITTAKINDAAITTAKINDAAITTAKIGLAAVGTANIQNAAITNALIANEAVGNAQIIGVSANKLTAGTIDASKITVTNLNASNINAGSLTVGGITIDVANNSSSVNGSSIVNGTITLNGLAQEVKDVIDGAIETFTGTVVPTLNNTPASSWTTNTVKDQHIGDVYYVVNDQITQNGYCYRFTKSGSGSSVTYEWQLIKDSDVTAALSRLQTAEGKIGNIETFDSTVSSFMTNTDGEISSLKTRTTNVETSIGDKVDVSTFNTVSQTVDENSASIITLTETTIPGIQSDLDGKADSSDVTTLSNTVNSVSQTATQNSSAISTLTQTTIPGIEQTLSQHGTSISNNATDIALKANSSDVYTKNQTDGLISTEVTNRNAAITAKANEITTSVSETYATKSALADGLEDANDYTDSEISSAKAEIKVTTDGISTEVSKKVGNSEIISKINQSAETVKIQASKVEIDGTAIFNSISSNVDSAITSKGYQTSSQVESAITSKGYATTGQVATAISTAVDNIDVGGRNYVSALAENWVQKTVSESKAAGTTWSNMQDTNTTRISTKELVPVSGASIAVSAASGYDVFITFFDVNGYMHSYLGWSNRRIVDLSSYSGCTHVGLTVRKSDNTSAITPSEAVNAKVKLELGNVATDWTPAPEDIQAEALDVEQQIYIQASSVSDVNTIALPSAWVEESGESTVTDSSGTVTGTIWTTKHPTYTRERPVTFVATQRRRLDGTIACTAPLPDDTTAVIDGGNLITGSVEARHIASSTLSIANMATDVTDVFDKVGEHTNNLNTLSGQAKEFASKAATFEAVETRVSSHDGQLQTIMNSLKFNEGELELKTQSGDDSTSVALTSEKMEFRANGTEVAYVSNEKLYIRNAQVLDNMQMGGFAWIPRSNGNLSLKWLGGVSHMNLLRGTGNIVAADYVLTRSTVTDGVVRLTPTTSAAYAKCKVDYLDYKDFAGETITFGLDARLSDVTSSYTSTNLRIYIGINSSTRTASTLSSTYDRYMYVEFTDLSSSWTRYTVTVKVPTDFTTGTADVLVAGNYLTAQAAVSGSRKPVDVRNFKLEIGTEATPWSVNPND